MIYLLFTQLYGVALDHQSIHLALPEQSGTRVALDMTTLTIMRYLPREVDPLVYNMSHEDPGDVTYNKIGGLAEQIRELREVSVHVAGTSVNIFFL